ncbi:hypothetical protein MauCBS54593_002112 [Microsporum audouinii]
MQIGALGEITEHIVPENPSTSSSSRAVSISLGHPLRIKVTADFWNKYDQYRMSQQSTPSEPPTKRQKFTPIPEPEPMVPATDVVDVAAEASDAADAPAATAAAQGPHRPARESQPQRPMQGPLPRPAIMDLDCDNKDGILHSDVSSLSDSDSSLVSGGDIDIPYSMADHPRPTAEAPLPPTNTPNGSQSVPPSSEKPPIRVKTSSTPAPEAKPSVMVTVANCGPGNFPVMQVIPNSQLAASLRDIPCARPIVWRNGVPRELRNQWTRDASIYFSRGELAAEPCTSCVRGRGPFEQCVRPPNPTGQPPLRGACASCIWTGNPRTCSFHPDHLLPGSSNSTPSKLVGKKLVPRTSPRTPNTPSSSVKPPSSATKAPPSLTKPSPHPAPFDHSYNNINHNNNSSSSSHNNNNNINNINHANHSNTNNPNTQPHNNGMPPKNSLPVSPAQTIPPSIAPSPTNALPSSSLPPPSTQRTNPFPNHCYFKIPEKLNGGNLTEVRKAIQEMEAVQAKLKERAAFLEQLGNNWQ